MAPRTRRSLAPIMARVLTFAPVRWLAALVIGLFRVARVHFQHIRGVPSYIREVNRSLKPRPLTSAERRRIGKAHVKRVTRGLRNLMQHRRTVLGQLRGNTAARMAYLGALRELTQRGEQVGKERLAKLRMVSIATAREVEDAVELGQLRGRAA